LQKFKKPEYVSLEILSESKLSKCLSSKSSFLWLLVSSVSEYDFFENQIFGFCLTPNNAKIVVEEKFNWEEI
jgi:hypothetical protein